ncbi:hypothetical protein BHM03_00047433 [Ensete ventricosum]|nr:hypothetical protein BHM03_00047433 [Ensete ventricosum]
MAVKKAAESFSKALADEVQRWGGMKQTGVSLRYMMEFGARPTQKNLLLSAQFLHKELPMRIARRAIELEALPFGLSDEPAVLKVLLHFLFIVLWELDPGFSSARLVSPSDRAGKSRNITCRVRDWYLDSFRDLRTFPEIKDTSDELAFTQMIKMIKVRHNNVVPAMALGVQQLKRDMNRKVVPEELEEIHQFLDRFYLSRIGIRMLIGQPKSCSQLLKGIGPLNSIMLEIIRFFLLLLFPLRYVPSHLHLMVFELVKNSLRAVQERHMNSDKDVPLVRIIVADGIEDVTIKVCLRQLLTFAITVCFLFILGNRGTVGMRRD